MRSMNSTLALTGPKYKNQYLFFGTVFALAGSWLAGPCCTSKKLTTGHVKNEGATHTHYKDLVDKLAIIIPLEHLVDSEQSMLVADLGNSATPAYLGLPTWVDTQTLLLSIS